MDVCLRVLRESNKRSFDSYSVRNIVLIISRITFRDRRVHIFADNFSRNSRIWRSLTTVFSGKTIFGFRYSSDLDHIKLLLTFKEGNKSL